MADKPKALLFDLGGVVVDIDFGRVFRHWAQAAGVEADHIAQRFSMDENYRCHEKGTVTLGQFFDGQRQSLGIDISNDDFLAGWNAIFIGEVAGIGDVLRQVRQHYPIYAFSNTNETHSIEMFRRFGEVLGLFKRVFISSDMGCRKPDAEAFDWVLRQMGCQAQDVLFFDDTWENIEGAQAVGLRTCHVQSIKDVLDAGIT